MNDEPLQGEECGKGSGRSRLPCLRSVLGITILAEVWAGDLIYAAEAFLALASCTLAGSLLRGEGGLFPLEVEIVLLLMAVGHCTLGVANNLYRSLPYYDKFLHVANPLALAFYGLLILATRVDVGSRKIPTVALTILAITGASAVWEILEYASDQTLNSTAQGSPTMTPLDDTMWDLILSFGGALLGGVAAALSSLRANAIPDLFGRDGTRDLQSSEREHGESR